MQPPPGLREQVHAVVESHRDTRGALLPALHDLQDQLGYIPADAVAMLAEDFNLSRAEVYGTLTFYRDFRDRPPAEHHVRLCVAEACQANGSSELVEHARASLGIDLGEQLHDGRIELGEVFCLGNCALGPSIEIDGRVHGRVDATRFDELVAPK